MKLITGIIILFMSLPVFADAPEFLYQPADGEHAFNINYAYRSYGIDFEDSSAVAGEDWEWNWEYNIVGLKYDWGFSDSFSFGVGLDYITGNLEFTSPSFGATAQRDWSISGIESIDLNFKGNHGFGFFNLHYGLILDLSLETQHYEQQFSRSGAPFIGRVNASKGRHEITPYIAANMTSGARNYGLKLAYQHNLDTTHTFEDASGVETESVREGGHGLFLSLYYEAMLKDSSLFGVAVNYQSFQDQEIIEDDNAANVGLERKDYEYSTDGFRFDFYGKVKTGMANLDFLPKFSYFLSSDKDHEDGPLDPNGDPGAISSTGGSYQIEFNLRKEF